jgi:hypothetical protein
MSGLGTLPDASNGFSSLHRHQCCHANVDLDFGERGLLSLEMDVSEMKKEVAVPVKSSASVANKADAGRSASEMTASCKSLFSSLSLGSVPLDSSHVSLDTSSSTKFVLVSTLDLPFELILLFFGSEVGVRFKTLARFGESSFSEAGVLIIPQ